MSFSNTPRSSTRRRFLKGLTSAGVVTFVGTGIAGHCIVAGAA
jgi:hypothetical protein